MSYSFVKNDHFIPLLSDTLPYETPFFFSNHGFYTSLKKAYNEFYKANNIKKAKGEKVDMQPSLTDFFCDIYFREVSILKNKIKSKSGVGAYFIPFRYKIKKNDVDFRSISLIHPISQLRVCEFYKKYSDIILFYCNRSPYSLRHPKAIVSKLKKKHESLLNKFFKEADEGNTSDLKQRNIEDHEPLSLEEIPSSYFILDRYAIIYKFYESLELLDLEKKFLYLQRLDVKRCFDSIYTHSITWAIKGKAYVKGNLKYIDSSFEGKFDTLMQKSNYNETNGIPIGAEVSRVFAEIILQRIDLDIAETIAEKPILGRTLRQGRDFEIRRYVDDYFIFANEKAICDRIQSICADKLSAYRLFINESKNSQLERPFITAISVAKQQINTVLSDYLEKFGFDKTASGASKRQPRLRDGSALIHRLRIILHDNEIDFYKVVNIALARLKDNLLDALAYTQEIKNETLVSHLRGYLKNILEIAFYVLHLSPRSNSASLIFKIGYIALEIAKATADKEFLGEIRQDIFTRGVLFYEKLTGEGQAGRAECLDVILLLNELGDEFRLSVDRLEKIFSLDSEEELSYFEVVSFLAYIKNDTIYQPLKDQILGMCRGRLLRDVDLERAENFLLFFDLIKCPYLTGIEKGLLLDKIGFSRKSRDDRDNIITFIEGKGWFFDWDLQENLNLKNVLEIKVRRTAY